MKKKGFILRICISTFYYAGNISTSLDDFIPLEISKI